MRPLLLVLAAALLLAPGTAAAANTGRLTLDTMDGLRCVGVSELGKACGRQEALFITHAVDGDRLGPLVVAGLGGDDAVSVRIRVKGARDEVRPGRWGSYLFMLAPSTRQRDVVITIRKRRGKPEVIDYRRTRNRSRPVPGSDRVETTLANPNGGRLGLLTWRAVRGQLCWHLGDVLGGRVGALRGSTFTEYPINDGGSCATPVKAPAGQPLGYGLSWGDGRATVTGLARDDVRAVALQMADGTLRPLTLTPRRFVVAAFRLAIGERLPYENLVVTLADGTQRTLPLAPPGMSLLPPQPAG